MLFFSRDGSNGFINSANSRAITRGNIWMPFECELSNFDFSQEVFIVKSNQVIKSFYENNAAAVLVKTAATLLSVLENRSVDEYGSN